MNNNDMNNENIIKMSIQRIMEDRFGRYSKYIIQDRAIPDVRDGLKPVQRRILYAMRELRLFHDTAFKKSARVIGEVIGKYHPHGDSSIYEAMVRLAQPWKVHIPLVEMHGNKGSVDGDPPAAMRYTEARLTYFSEKMMNNIYKNTVLFVPNFDDSESEPSILPTLIPNLLINGATGIASGYATEMPPHNLSEIINAIIYRLENPECTFDDLDKIVLGPDFPTGGEIEFTPEIKQALLTGRGKIIIRSKYEIIQNKTTPRIIISEIPFGVNKSKLVKAIDNIIFNKQIYGMKSIVDESDKEGIRIVIHLKSDAKISAIEKYLLQKTPLQIFYHYNNIAIHNKSPKLMNLISLIDAYIEHRSYIVKQFTKFDLKKSQLKKEIIEGLVKVGKNPDEIINAIRQVVGSRKGVVLMLIDKFDFTENQANAIADLKLYRLSSTDRREYGKEIKELNEKIIFYKNILKHGGSLKEYMIKDLSILKDQFPSERKTKIIHSTLNLKINESSLIKDEDIILSISKLGYIKKFSNKVLDSNTISTFNLKEKDILVHISKTTSKHKTLIFTSKGNFILIPNHKFLEAKWKDVGTHINNYTDLTENARVIGAIDVEDATLPFYIVMVSKKGKIKRTKLEEFNFKRFAKSSTAFKLEEDDELLDVQLSTGLQNVLIITKYGFINKYNEREINSKGVKAGGAYGIKLIPHDEIATFAIAKDNEDIAVTFIGGLLAKIRVSDIQYKKPRTAGVDFFKLSRRTTKIPQYAHSINDRTVVIYSGMKKEIYQTSKINNLKYITLDYTGKIPRIGSANSKHSIILAYNKANNEHHYLKDLDNVDSIDDVFKEEEEKIAQISIEDLLKQ